jgi:hypothetical protein
MKCWAFEMSCLGPTRLPFGRVSQPCFAYNYV